MKEHEIKLDKCDTKLLISYNYDYEKGIHTYPNGDPGLPDSEDIEILAIDITEGNWIDILDCYKTTSDVITEIKEKISMYEQD